jgi:hypothetical protein
MFAMPQASNTTTKHEVFIRGNTGPKSDAKKTALRETIRPCPPWKASGRLSKIDCSLRFMPNLNDPSKTTDVSKVLRLYAYL